jgi:hypothetical protein
MNILLHPTICNSPAAPYKNRIVYVSKSLQHAITLQKAHPFHITALPYNICPLEYHGSKQQLNECKLATTFNIWSPLQSYKNARIINAPYILIHNILYSVKEQSYEIVIRK